jgi:hypothetical protein
MRTNALPIALRGYEVEHEANRLFSFIDRDAIFDQIGLKSNQTADAQAALV